MDIIATVQASGSLWLCASKGVRSAAHWSNSTKALGSVVYKQCTSQNVVFGKLMCF